MKLQINLDTENKKDIDTLGRIYKALSNKETKSDLDAYIKKYVQELINK